MTQTELFPMSAVDIATAFLDHFEDECEKRLKAVISAKDKLLDAQKLRDMAEAELRRAQDHVPSGPIANAAEALKAAAQANGFGVTLAAGGEEVVVCEPPEVDPVTGEVAANTGEKMEQGEVAPTTVSTTVERTCPECDGYGRLPDKTGAAKLTIQKFYLPNGSSTQNKGVTPDIVLPSIEEYMPIGESDLPHALIWDEIPSTTFSGRPLDPQILAPLRDASQSRQEHLEEFAYLKKSIAWYKVKQELKEIPLNLDERRRQKEVDDAFKKTMDTEKDQLAKSDFPYKEFTLVPPVPQPATVEKKTEAADSEDESTEEDAGITKLDIHLRESLRVLSDALSLSKNPRYWANGSAPLTVQVSKNG